MSGHPRLALLALAAGGFAIGTTEFVTMGLLPEVAAGVGIDIPTAGHVVSAYAAGVVVGAPLLAALGAKLPRKHLLLWLMAAFAVAHLASALATILTAFTAIVTAREASAAAIFATRLKTSIVTAIFSIITMITTIAPENHSRGEIER